MELKPEILELLSSGKDNIREIRLTYRNGGQVKGAVLRLRVKTGTKPIVKLVIDKHDPRPGERSRHRAVLEHLTEIWITAADGTEHLFRE